MLTHQIIDTYNAHVS